MSSAAASAPKSTGRKAKTAAAPAASTAVAAPVAAAPAPVAVAAPAPVAVAAPAPVVESAAATTAEEPVNIVAEFNSVVEKINSLRTALAATFSDMKKLEKRIPRELKKAQKGRRRKAAATEGGEEKPKKETVFTKPTPISDALCTFLGLPKGSSVSRSEVTSKVCTYAKSKNLMEKKFIKADAALRKLLALKEGDELQILNLQRFLKPHYIKPSTA